MWVYAGFGQCIQTYAGLDAHLLLKINFRARFLTATLIFILFIFVLWKEEPT